MILKGESRKEDIAEKSIDSIFLKYQCRTGRKCAMKRNDKYLYIANGRLHRSLFGAINEKGEVKIVKDNQVLTKMNEKQAKALERV